MGKTLIEGRSQAVEGEPPWKLAYQGVMQIEDLSEGMTTMLSLSGQVSVTLSNSIEEMDRPMPPMR